MIKNALKNFIKNAVYMFVAMGIVYLFLLITVFFLLSKTIDNFAVTLDALGKFISSSIDASSASINEFISYAINQIDWDSNIFETIKQIINTNWLKNTLTGFFQTLSASTEGFEDQLNIIVSDFISRFIDHFIVAISISAVGILLANFATKFAIRLRSAEKNPKQLLVAYVMMPLLQTIVIVVFFLLFAVIGFYSLLVVLALLLGMGVVSIIASWLVYRDNSLKLRNILTLKNVFMHLGVIGIILLINLIFDSILFLINPIFALLIMIPLSIYSFNIVDINTDVYVCSLIQAKKES